MKEKRQYLLLFTGLIAVALLSVCAGAKQKDSDGMFRRLFGHYTKIFAPPVPPAISFAGEAAPLDLYYVREALDREIMAATFMHTSTLLMFKRANRWFPVIEPILKKNGIPDDFKFLAVAESNLSNAVSSAKAEGFWQFLKSTGQEYGLEITDQVDERYHLEKATEAACAYLNAAYRKYGSWTLAAAAYNRGSDGLTRAITSQQVDSYYDLFLNEETARYVYRIMAAKEVYLNPVKYGFYLTKEELHPQIRVKEITLETPVADLPAFAKSIGINYRVVRELNPWIRGYALTGKPGKSYRIKVPADGMKSLRFTPGHPADTDPFLNDTLRIRELR